MTSKFTKCEALSTGHGFDYRVRIVLGPTTHKFEYVPWGSQFGSHVSQFVPRFNRPGFIFRLNIYDGNCVAIYRILPEPVEIAFEMDLCPCGDVSSYDLIRMSQTLHVFLCRMLTRNPDYVIDG